MLTYDPLKQRLLPFFYDQRASWIRLMQQSIILNASLFNTPRLVRQYPLHFLRGPRRDMKPERTR